MRLGTDGCRDFRGVMSVLLGKGVIFSHVHACVKENMREREVASL